MVLVEVSFDLTASPRDVWADTTSGFLIGSVEWRNLFLGSASLSVPAFRQHPLHQGPSHWRHPSALLFLGMPERVAGLAVLKPWKQGQLLFPSLCYQDGRACHGFVAGKRRCGAGGPGLLSQENLSCGPLNLKRVPAPCSTSCTSRFLNLCHTSTGFMDLGWVLGLLWVLEGGACISRTLLCHGISAGQQQEVLQGKLPFPTFKTDLYLSL